MRPFRCDERGGTHGSKPFRHTWSREVGNSRGRPKSVPMSAAEGVVRRTARLSSHYETRSRRSAGRLQPRARPHRSRPRPRASRAAPEPLRLAPGREPSFAAASVTTLRRSSNRRRGTRHAAWPRDPASSSPRVRCARRVAHRVRPDRAAPLRSRPRRRVAADPTPNPERPSSACRLGPSPPARARGQTFIWVAEPGQRPTSSSSSAATERIYRARVTSHALVPPRPLAPRHAHRCADRGELPLVRVAGPARTGGQAPVASVQATVVVARPSR